MAIFEHDPPLTPLPPTSDVPDQSVFQCLVKSYYHAKSWASSSKIEQVMQRCDNRLILLESVAGHILPNWSARLLC